MFHSSHHKCSPQTCEVVSCDPGGDVTGEVIESVECSRRPLPAPLLLLELGAIGGAGGEGGLRTRYWYSGCRAIGPRVCVLSLEKVPFFRP